MNEPEYLRKWNSTGKTHVSIAQGCKGKFQKGETCDDCCMGYTQPCHRLNDIEIAAARLRGEI